MPSTESVELIVSTNRLYTGEVLSQPTRWMKGPINGGQFENNVTLHAAAVAIMDSIEPISEAGVDGSTCTDGRKRLGLEDGQACLGATPQAVGGILMSAFAAMETLGPKAYSQEMLDATAVHRLRYTADRMREAGFVIGRHVGCGGVESFVDIHGNGGWFAQEPSYISRLQRLVPESIAGPEHVDRAKRIAANAFKRIIAGKYDDYSTEVVEAVVGDSSGSPVVEVFEDDNRGVHGHRERLIANLVWNLPGVAINPNTLIEQYDLQTFGVSGELLDRIARNLSRDGAQEDDYANAWYAMKHFTASAHGTLGNNLPTILIRPNGIS
jgi:hypothetical protein